MTSTLNPQSTSHQYVPVAKSQVREDYHQVLDDLSDAVIYLATAKAVTGAEFQIDMGSSKV